ncbi:hypothetical protein EW145_g4534 [Phellinidium pouzarii]|uniref:Polynucleotide 5'-hydroxyl-kinase GRC3 n=1 Tax=Phellinidium pouzarii TaxID=167371 RepID=A0A4S4L819_9AGAM|nr:hypothetical protein EW145_g4534 [Phellinidium pouzarii]
MLSAIAARKAAQAVKLAAQHQPPQPPLEKVQLAIEDSVSDSERLETIFQSQKSKRKPLASSEVQARKRRRKKASKSENLQTRYYEQNTEDSLIESLEKEPKDIGDESNTDSEGEGEGEGEGEAHFIGDDGRSELDCLFQGHRKVKRPWSPSQPPPNSSDEEAAYEPGSSMLAAEEPLVIPPQYPRQQDAGFKRIRTLSFTPKLDKNIFHVDNCDFGIFVGRSGTLIALSEDDTIALIGVYSMTVLQGTVSFMGSDLYASPTISHTVFAPRCSPIPIIKALAVDTSVTSDNGLNISGKIAQLISPHCTLVFFEEISTGVEDLGKVCKTFEGTFDAEAYGESILRLRSAKMILSLSRSMQPFQTPASWQIAFASLSKASSPNSDILLERQVLVAMVRGQKRTGKSYLARTILNRLLGCYRRVAFLECDLGQTEFTPPGFVSLNLIDRPMFGPPFTHPLLPYNSHYIGSASPLNSPSHYLSSIRALMQTYKIDLQYVSPEDEVLGSDGSRIDDVIPLVVNTMGWTKGLGADLARQIEEAVEPTHIFSIQNPSGDFETGMETMKVEMQTLNGSGNNHQVFEVEPISVGIQSTRHSAADWRTISLISYFHSIPSMSQTYLLSTSVQHHNDFSFISRSAPLYSWDCRLPLVARSPYAVAPNVALDSVILIGAGSEDVVPSEIGRVLNGALVAIVAYQPDYTEISPSQAWRGIPYSQGADPPDPLTSRCIGLALIRGVSQLTPFSPPLSSENTDGDTLHVLTPLPPWILATSGARCFVKGEIELPVWGMLDFREIERDGARHDIDGIPYLQWSKTEAAGAERRRVRRNLMRRGQM